MHCIKEVSLVSSCPDLSRPLDIATLRAPIKPTEQFEGLFKGLGVSSKTPICKKRDTDLKKLHSIAHFAVGAKHWDSLQKTSTSHEAYQDHGVAFQRHDIPDKMASVVELKQGGYDGKTHFRTEQRERFVSCYRPRLPQCDPPPCRVHFGDDKPELASHSNAVHVMQDDRDLRSPFSGQPFRAAGVGTLLRTTSMPRIPRVNPVTAGPRNPDPYDMHTNLQNVQTGAFGRKTANHSSIVRHPNVRDPILGIHKPKDSLQISDLKTTADMIAEQNSSVPSLRTLSAIRPRSGEAMKYPEVA